MHGHRALVPTCFPAYLLSRQSTYMKLGCLLFAGGRMLQLYLEYMHVGTVCSLVTKRA